MLARLCGKLLALEDTGEVLLDVAGIGYEVWVPQPTLAALSSIGTTVILYTHFIVREDNQSLYGFTNKSERNLFRKIIKVSGVGPKLALAILSTFPEKELLVCVASKDAKLFAKVPGIGLKKAQRVIIELFNTLDVAKLDLNLNQATNNIAASYKQQAIDALLKLGFSLKDVQAIVTKVMAKDDLSCEQIIKESLQLLAKEQKAMPC